MVIAGGGLSGLTAAIKLAQAGIEVLVVEKKQYPFHRVCGEYVSNEVLPFLKSIGADPAELNSAAITNFMLSSPSGNTLTASLDLGGFGISRYTLDNFLYQKATEAGVSFKLKTSVQDIRFSAADDNFTLSLSDGSTLCSKIVIGAYGKRATLDRQLQRRFFLSRSPYIGVKYHLRLPFPKNLIALHNFKDGYAGISAIEDNKYCFCYLTTRQNLKQHGSIPAMEEKVLAKNPFLNQIFEKGEFLYQQPEVINEISFAPKAAVEQHILMSGDAAGMITPLCGNGMAMAIHGAKLLSEQLLHYFRNGQNRQHLEQAYRQAWQQQFSRRLQTGRTIQHLFGSTILSEAAVGLLKRTPFAVNLLMKQTHGKPF
ncbi:MAG: NAD(P)/FAD-dependent oxidoreductase [Hymenobacteraceae bacterium]|nr:NAD(P)/FAD-dependent oxidoreductase [Hymenobacteraceae bacterium]MDX5395907.1 NAD(P)/FAD-dependent oxidoreductase [Hymenobacteraceae bacterium]MDX5511964.1 NAD(P)/FAD-dependent oxidoreductase [Hymenobacteraceae bacterium]